MCLDSRRGAAAFFAATSLVSMLWNSSAACAPYAYVVNGAAGTMSVIDTQTDKVASTFTVDEKPTAIAASIDGARLYIAHQSGNFVERDLFTEKSVRFTAGGPARTIRLSPDGKLLSVIGVDSDAVGLVDMATLRVLNSVRIGGKKAAHAVFSPDGKWIYADAEGGDSIDVIDVAKRAVIKSIRVGHGANDIGFASDGTRAYVAANDDVVVIDVSRHEVIARVESEGRLGNIAVHPDGKRVFVSAQNARTVQVFDARSNRFTAKIDVSSDPSGMAFTPDGSKLYVVCSRANEVTVIDTSTYARIQTIAVGALPAAVVISEPPTLPRDGD